MHPNRATTGWMALLLAAGCAPPIDLAVDVRTDLLAGREFDRVVVELDGDGAVPVVAERDDDFRDGLRVAEFRGLSGERHIVTVALSRAGAPVVSRRVSLRIEGSLILPVVLTRDCRGIACPGTGNPVTDSECLGGTCTVPTCSPLDPSSCGAPECAVDADCPAPSACASARCADGVCLSPVRDAACGPGQICDPSAGCVADGQGPPSCAQPGPGRTDCGAGEDCCVSLPVAGGTFFRSDDDTTPGFVETSAPATVSDFRLDRYEITVGRFRAFVAAVLGGYRPAPGSGRHTHVGAGLGVSNSAASGGTEAGWDPAWSATLPTTEREWSQALTCNPAYATWTDLPGDRERRPVSCLRWPHAVAFCIWDGGFLPSEAEWNFAAAGGAEQRVRPWSTPPGSLDLDASHAVFGAAAPADVGSRPAGDGRFGQADLCGNVSEWTMDAHVGAYPAGSCVDCSHLPPAPPYRAIRGGDFIGAEGNMTSAERAAMDTRTTGYGLGARCARLP
jgi:formylglycine-generating enzyme required for sulfatase activity